MKSLVVDISLPRAEYLKVYESYIKSVRAIAQNGQTVRFPVSVLKPYVTPEGIHGTFRLIFDAEHKFSRVERLSQ
ncbi:MAG: DUF2835 domain-containing protein [Pseudomonadales bacterium]|nr:DUF2835 domain-containing protein [Pseudomonadales bacterium]